MKKMKKFLATMLAMVMVLGMTATASAAEPTPQPGTGTEADKGTITIQGVDESVVATDIKLYPVLTANYDPNTENFTGYVAVEAAKSKLNELQAEYASADENKGKNLPTDFVEALKKGEGNYAPIDAEMINALAKLNLSELSVEPNYTVTKVVTNQTITIGEGESAKEVKVANYTCTGVPVGMYLVSIPGTETIIYNHAIASIYYVENNGMASQPLIMNSAIAAKATLAPTVKKDAEDEKNGGSANSVNVGDIIKYTVKVNPIPNYSGKNPELKVVDTLSANLELQNINVTDKDGNKNLVVKVGDTVLDKGTYYTAESAPGNNGSTVLTVNFVVEKDGKKIYTLSDYAGQELVIEYKAELTNSAAGNQEVNKNDVILNYTRDSKIDGDGGKGTSDDETYTYTFNIGGTVTGVGDTSGFITKVGEENSEGVKEPLQGAYFTMYTAGENNTRVKYTNETDSFITAEQAAAYAEAEEVTVEAGTLRSNDEGYITVKGLKEGTYYLKETTAPKGYTLNSHEYVIVVSAKYYGITDGAPAASKEHPEGTLYSWSIKIDDKEANTFEVQNNGDANLSGGKTLEDMTKVQIQNTTMSTLPSTGGIGTTIFTIGGCAIMILAAALFFASRRKNLRK